MPLPAWGWDYPHHPILILRISSHGARLPPPKQFFTRSTADIFPEPVLPTHRLNAAKELRGTTRPGRQPNPEIAARLTVLPQYIPPHAQHDDLTIKVVTLEQFVQTQETGHLFASG